MLCVGIFVALRKYSTTIIRALYKSGLRKRVTSEGSHCKGLEKFSLQLATWLHQTGNKWKMVLWWDVTRFELFFAKLCMWWETISTLNTLFLEWPKQSSSRIAMRSEKYLVCNCNENWLKKVLTRGAASKSIFRFKSSFHIIIMYSFLLAYHKNIPI